MPAALLSAWAACAAIHIAATCYRATNESLHMLLANTGRRPASITHLWLDGTDLIKNQMLLPPARGCRFVRIWPQPIPPGARAEVTISLLNNGSDPLKVRIQASDGSQDAAAIPRRPEPARICGMYFSPDLRTIHVYLRVLDSSAVSRSARILQVRLNGRPAKPIAGRLHFSRGSAYFALSAHPRPAQVQVIEADVQAKSSTYRCFAALAAFHVPAVIGTYGNFGEPYRRDYAAHGLNHYLAFHSPSPAELDGAARHGLTVGGHYIGKIGNPKSGKLFGPSPQDQGRWDFLKNKPAFLYYSLIDEPDCLDYYYGRHGFVRGNYYWRLGSTAPVLLRWIEWFHRRDPRHFTFIQINNTCRPYNWMCYCLLPDVPATHYYGIGRPGGLSRIWSTLSALKRCAEPHPVYAVIQLCRVGASPSGRDVTADELAWQQYAALALGAHGTIYYIHSGSRSAPKSRDAWDAAADLHWSLRKLDDLRWLAEPVDWARCQSPAFGAQALQCGEKALILAIVRKDCLAAENGLQQIRPATAQVRLVLPSWLRLASLSQPTAKSWRPIPFKSRGNLADVTLPDLRVGTVLVGRLAPLQP